MAEKKSESVTLVKGNREVTLTLPSEIVHYKAAGWREKPDEKPEGKASAPAAAKSGSDDAKGGAKK